jgi:hypothetical protein
MNSGSEELRLRCGCCKKAAKAIGPGGALTVALDYRVRVLKVKSPGSAPRRRRGSLSVLRGFNARTGILSSCFGAS